MQLDRTGWFLLVNSAVVLIVGQAQAQNNTRKKPPRPHTESVILATGQTTSYYPRDDGDLENGTPLPNPRFLDQGDGTVVDLATGLVWLRQANCYGSQTWTTALDRVNLLASGMCGLSDGSTVGVWRLPNIREVLSLLDYAYFSPALSPNPFVNVIATDWSSTTSARSTTEAWTLNFDVGAVGRSNKELGLNLILPVRDK